MAVDLGFELLPADDEGLSPAQELDAAIAGATVEPGAIVPQAEDPPEPLGRTWAFDWASGQFRAAGGGPAPISGLAAVEEWVQMVVHSARYAHRVFADEFGMEGPEEPIGTMAGAEIVSEYEQHLREAILVHDRITALEKFQAVWSPAAGVLTIAYFEVVTDEEEVVSFSSFSVAVNSQ